jgi:hypothetical protein
MYKKLSAVVGALLAVTATMMLAACGGGHSAPKPTPTPQANCRSVPLRANGAIDRPIQHPNDPKVKAAVKSAWKLGPACANTLKAPPPTIRGLPTGVPKSGVVRVTPRGTSTVEQFDSVDDNFPGDTHYAAGYVNGLYQTFSYVINHFGPCCSVGIDVYAAHVNARATDLEPGNPSPSAAGPWAHWQIYNTTNKRPIVYTMGSWWSDVASSLAQWGIPHCSSATQQNCYLIWIANWTYSPGLWAGMDCRQWTDRARGINLDESTCGTWVYGAPKPPPPPMYYERYAQQKISTPWGTATRQEFAWVFNYDWYRPYYPANKQAVINLQVKMRWWANQLAYRIHHSSAAENARYYRNARFGELTARYKGKRCNPAGWQACVNG